MAKFTNATWACFDCRETVRRPAYTRTSVRCPSCAEACIFLGDMLRMPSKCQAREWRKLRLALQERNLAIEDQKQVRRVRKIHQIEKTIAELEVKGITEQHAQQIQALRLRLAEA